jgi:glycerol uptake facilitator-like aquaporin
MTKERRLVAEALGTALLTAVVVGSGMMAEQLAQGQVAIALLANAIVSGLGLAALLLMLGPVSGAHLNPVVTLSEAWQQRFSSADVLPYILAQTTGAFAGIAATHMMFDAPLFSVAEQARTGSALWFGEFIATFGLIAVTIGTSRHRPDMLPFAVPAYVAAAFWFTSSSAFVNPSITLAKAMSNSFAGIRPIDVPGFIVAQLLGAALATFVLDWLYRPLAARTQASSPVVQGDLSRQPD